MPRPVLRASKRSRRSAQRTAQRSSSRLRRFRGARRTSTSRTRMDISFASGVARPPIEGRLIATARSRLPGLANQIFEGNVLDWSPPHTFTFVHTGLEYVPAARRPWLVRRLVDHFVAPDGRLIVGPVAEAELPATIEAFERAETSPETSQRTDRNRKTRHVAWCRT